MMCGMKVLCVLAVCTASGYTHVEAATIPSHTLSSQDTPDTLEVLVATHDGNVQVARSKREPKHHHGFGGLFGGSSSGSSASASAGSGSSGFGGLGGSGSDSHASAQSQSYSFGPFSASFSQASAGSQSQSSGGGFFDDLF